MARVKEFRVMVASDGSLAATAATVTATCLPWPAGTRALGVVSRHAEAGAAIAASGDPRLLVA